MAETTKAPVAKAQKEERKEELKSHTVVLATGEMVQADNGIATHHYSEKLGRVVPVTTTFENGDH